MKRSILIGVAACSVLVATTASDAADVSAIKLKSGLTALVVTGEIKRGDGAKFRSEASKYKEAFVLLESDGGSLAEAIDIGETIRIKGYATAVINGSSCNSACALIWLAGTPRALSKSGRVGFHAAYSERGGSAQESGVANAMVGRYLTLLNLPEKAVIFATTSPPSQLSWLTASNYVRTGIDVSVMRDFDFSAGRSQSTTPPPLVRLNTSPKAKAPETTVWRKIDPWVVAVDHTLRESCFLLASFQRDTVFRIGVNRSGGGYYIMLGNPDWESLEAGQKYTVNFQFDDYDPWEVPTRGVNMGNVVLLQASFEDSAFWKEFVSSQTLHITRNNETVTKLALTGSRPAFDELVKCQKYEDALRKTRDPFAK